jgi:catechol 2,3-dioxygenase-like lactoylglutathione lyase family enzyme
MSAQAAGGSLGTFDQKVEVVVVPVADIERAKEFYVRLGWRLDVTPPTVVQLTPPGSWCSVQFGASLTTAAPGTATAYLVVTDIVAARDALIAAGVEVGDLFHLGPNGVEDGPDPDRGTYRTRAVFSDPDGNRWIMQEVTGRLPGRVEPGVTTYGSAADLAAAMTRAAKAHGEHEKRIGAADPDWPAWYSTYMVAEQAGTDLPQ